MKKNTKKLKQNVKHIPIDPTIPPLGIYTKEIFI